MNTKLYEKIQEGLEDIFQPPTEEEMGDAKKRIFLRKIEDQGAYQNEDGTWSCDNGIDVSGMGLESIPVQFKEVKDDFSCYNNKLTSLKGCPEIVKGCFVCHSNQLTSLEGGPRIVGGDFDCYDNRLVSLEGCPKEVGSHFSCRANQLTSLEGGPRIVGGDFDCSFNRITSLIDGPKRVGGDFYCNSNLITTLKGSPRITGGGMLYCRGNPVPEKELLATRYKR